MTDTSYLKQIADNTTEANERLESIKEAIELSGKTLAGFQGEDKVISLSYILRQAQADNGALGVAVKGLLVNQLSWYAGNHGVSSPRWVQDKWLKTQMRCSAQYKKEQPDGSVKYVDGAMNVTYKWIAIDPTESSYVDESANNKVLSNVPYEHQGHGYLIDLTDSSEPLSFERTESVTEASERSVTMTESTEIDVGVTSETTIGGEMAGVSVEEKIGLSLGYKDTKEKQAAETKSKSKTVDVKMAYEAQPGKATLLTVGSNEINAMEPFSWNGSVNYGFTLIAWKWVLETTWGGYMMNSKRAKVIGDKGGYSETWQIEWEDWDDFLSFWQGTNTDFPDSVNKSVSGTSAHFLTQLEGPALRYINLAGTEHRQYQDGAEMKVEDVTGQDLQAVATKHGAQIVKS